MGILRRGHLVEVDRSKLVAGYSGQTAMKTTEVVQSAMGGVLFVDEAYALISDERDAFGREALDTLIKLVEDHRDDLVVILAGYVDEMHSLLTKNPGIQCVPGPSRARSRQPPGRLWLLTGVAGPSLAPSRRSRFPTVIDFDDYTEAELMEITESMLRKEMMSLTTEAREVLQMKFEAMARLHSRQNGNGRAVRNTLEAAKRRQALRLVQWRNTGRLPQKEEMSKLAAADFRDDA